MTGPGRPVVPLRRHRRSPRRAAIGAVLRCIPTSEVRQHMGLPRSSALRSDGD